MPRQKTTKDASAAQAALTDTRFSSFTTDPRFRLPSKKNSRTKIDKRFSRMLEDEDFSTTAKVDRYGRKLSTSRKKEALERLYQPEDPEDEDEDEKGIEIEDDEVVLQELKKADAYDPARGGGFSSSSSDDDNDEEEDDKELGVEDEGVDFPDLQTEQAGVPLGQVSSRIAIVNLDWDNIRAVDLMAVCSSFVRPGGKVKKVSIYKSEFGKERMEREEMEGPPKEIFQKQAEDEDEELNSEDESKADDDDSEVDEQIRKDLLKEDDGKEFDNAALRQYQLERLRYYYAVMECSDNATAQNIYEATDGTEYLSSANFLDLRFIPDGTEFDDKATDECYTVPSGYKPHDFITDALRQSKVKLTWDAEDSTRKDVIKKAFSGSRAEIGENDLRAYLGSDTSDSDDKEVSATENTNERHLSRKELTRQKMREALGLPVEPEISTSAAKSGDIGDMEITFTAGLSSADKSGVFLNQPMKDETTAETYIRKEKERKARRREKAKAIREGREAEVEADIAPKMEDEKEADLGFGDPFFAADETARIAASKAAHKEAKKQKRLAREAEAAETAGKKAELELLMADNSTDAPAHLDHFDINEISRAEKLKKRKGGKSKVRKEKDMAEQGGKRGGLQGGFQMDVQDPRFSKVFESHEFAIDPSNPKFKGTEGMKMLLEEGRRKRKNQDSDDEKEAPLDRKVKKRNQNAVEEKGELKNLIQTLKRKSK